MFHLYIPPPSPLFGGIIYINGCNIGSITEASLLFLMSMELQLIAWLPLQVNVFQLHPRFSGPHLMAPWPSFSPSVEAHVDTAKSHGHTDLLSAAVDSDSACVRVGSACRHAGGLVLVQDSERMGREVFSLQVAVTARPGCVEPSRLSATPPPAPASFFCCCSAYFLRGHNILSLKQNKPQNK